jgi:hypothetical protein
MLRFVCTAHEQRWARPGEILGVLGLREAGALAAVVRTRIEDDVYASG